MVDSKLYLVAFTLVVSQSSGSKERFPKLGIVWVHDRMRVQDAIQDKLNAEYKTNPNITVVLDSFSVAL